jgi:hypothetical protein
MVTTTSLLAACKSDLVRPVVQSSAISSFTLSSRSNVLHAEQPGKRGRSKYHCTLVIPDEEQGGFKRGLGYIAIPDSLTQARGTRVVQVRVQPTLGKSVAGANCRIPDSDDAEQYLLQHVLFVDPKTMRNGAASRSMSPDDHASQSVDPTLTTIYIIAKWSWPSIAGMGGYGGEDDTIDNPPSVPGWTPDPYYDDPGQPCVGYADGLGEYVDQRDIWYEDVENCPRTAFESICLVNWITD